MEAARHAPGASLEAAPRVASRVVTSSGPRPSALTISVVTPCVSLLAAVRRPVGVAWLWMLMKPGATYNPVASTSVVARAPDRSPTRVIVSPVMPTSARCRGAPVPSNTVPPRMTTSKAGGGCMNANVSAKSSNAGFM